jgi:hypothetical protein
MGSSGSWKVSQAGSRNMEQDGRVLKSQSYINNNTSGERCYSLGPEFSGSTGLVLQQSASCSPLEMQHTHIVEHMHTAVTSCLTTFIVVLFLEPHVVGCLMREMKHSEATPDINLMEHTLHQDIAAQQLQ